MSILNSSMFKSSGSAPFIASETTVPIYGKEKHVEGGSVNKAESCCFSLTWQKETSLI